MAANSTSATFLTVSEFDAVYGGEAGWEYWFGEARRKAAPTYLHGLLQFLLGELLNRAGYSVSGESDLKISSEWQPRPDVCGVPGEVKEKYITRPDGVVVFEVLSDGDETVTKCQHYSKIKISQIFVFDPVARTIANWDGEKLVQVTDVRLANGVVITGATIWSEFVKRQQRQVPAAMRI
jgi:Uma2 family endonuclease